MQEIPIRYLFTLIVGMVLLQSCAPPSFISHREELEVTKQHEMMLTDQFGDEAHDAILHYELSHQTIEAYNTGKDIDEVTTLQWRDRMHKWAKILRESNNLRVIDSVEIQSLRVVQLMEDRFKAVACVKLDGTEMTTKGNPLGSWGYERCGIYVFYRESATWKVAGYLDTTRLDYMYQDWDYSPNWLKEVIGELPRDPSMIGERDWD